MVPQAKGPSAGGTPPVPALPPLAPAPPVPAAPPVPDVEPSSPQATNRKTHRNKSARAMGAMIDASGAFCPTSVRTAESPRTLQVPLRASSFGCSAHPSGWRAIAPKSSRLLSWHARCLFGRGASHEARAEGRRRARPFPRFDARQRTPRDPQNNKSRSAASLSLVVLLPLLLVFEGVVDTGSHAALDLHFDILPEPAVYYGKRIPARGTRRNRHGFRPPSRSGTQRRVPPLRALAIHVEGSKAGVTHDLGGEKSRRPSATSGRARSGSRVVPAAPSR